MPRPSKPKELKPNASQRLAAGRTAAEARAAAMVADKGGMVKPAPAKPANSRMAAQFKAQALADEVTRQAIADNASPAARKAAQARKRREAATLARAEALKAPVPRDTYIPAHAEAICNRMAEGEDVGEILKDLGVSFGSMCAWMRKVPSFAAAFALARENQAHLYISQITRIADNATGKGELARLQVDTRKWLASKILNKIYGDKVQVSGDAENPLVTRLVSSADDLVNKIKGTVE